MEEKAEEHSTYREKHMQRPSIRKDREDSGIHGPVHRTFSQERRLCRRGEETCNHGEKWRMSLERQLEVLSRKTRIC